MSTIRSDPQTGAPRAELPAVVEFVLCGATTAVALLSTLGFALILGSPRVTGLLRMAAVVAPLVLWLVTAYAWLRVCRAHREP
jgi:hypothetical protein